MRTILALLALLLITPAAAQTSQLPVGNNSISITTGNTYQLVAARGQSMRSLTIQNNNATDACYVELSGLPTAAGTSQIVAGTTTTSTVIGGMATSKWSILLAAGASLSRYYPFIPLGPIFATCATTGDSLYVDWQ